MIDLDALQQEAESLLKIGLFGKTKRILQQQMEAIQMLREMNTSKQGTATSDTSVAVFDSKQEVPDVHGHIAYTKPEEPTVKEPINIVYTNWRGETSPRRIEPRHIWFGSTQWHPEPQWFLNALDLEKSEVRDFALKDMYTADLSLDLSDEDAVAWYTDYHTEDSSATTWDREVAQRWRDKGWTVLPLFDHFAVTKQILKHTKDK